MFSKFSNLKNKIFRSSKITKVVNLEPKEAPLKFQLNFMKFYGYQLNYSPDWKGRLNWIWGWAILGCLIMGTVCALHSFFNNFDNMQIMIESMTTTINWMNCFLRVTTIVVKRNRLRNLIEDLQRETRLSN
jgi:hypothetical protein